MFRNTDWAKSPKTADQAFAVATDLAVTLKGMEGNPNLTSLFKYGVNLLACNIVAIVASEDLYATENSHRKNLLHALLDSLSYQILTELEFKLHEMFCPCPEDLFADKQIQYLTQQCFRYRCQKISEVNGESNQTSVPEETTGEEKWLCIDCSDGPLCSRTRVKTMAQIDDAIAVFKSDNPHAKFTITLREVKETK